MKIVNYCHYYSCNYLKAPKEARSWLQEVEKIDAQAKSIDSTTDVGGCFNLKTRHKFERKGLKIDPDINRLMEEKVDSVKRSSSITLGHHNDFKSRERTFMKAFNALKADRKPHMIALCGMGDVGKTTMMQKLKKAVSENKMFDFAIKAAIGEKMEVSIQQVVVGFLGIDLKESTKAARAIKLRNGFEVKSDIGKKKFLLILDNVWQCMDLIDIGLSIKSNQGIDFKVLLTSRDRNVCIMMGVELDSILNLDVIQDSEPKDFFIHL